MTIILDSKPWRPNSKVTPVANKNHWLGQHLVGGWITNGTVAQPILTKYYNPVGKIQNGAATPRPLIVPDSTVSGMYADLDGTNDYFDCGNEDAGDESSSFMILAGCYYDAYGGSDDRPVSKASGGFENDHDCMLSLTKPSTYVVSRFRFITDFGSTDTALTDSTLSSDEIPAGEFFVMGGFYNGAIRVGHKVHGKNAVLGAVATDVSGKVAFRGKSWSIGRNGSSAGSEFNGIVPFVFLFNWAPIQEASNEDLSLRILESIYHDPWQVFEPVKTLIDISASSDTVVNCTTDALTLTENVASIVFDVTVNTITKALTLTENTASVSLDVTINTTTDALTLAENTASIVYDVTVNGIVDALVLTENTASIQFDVTVNTSTDALILTEGVATISTGGDVTINTITDTLVLVENQATIVYDVDVNTTTHALVLNTLQAIIHNRPLNSAPINTANSKINIYLDNVPQIEDLATYEAVLALHSALDSLLAQINDKFEEYVKK